MRVLDERFLTVHPRTAMWWEQREQCRRCAHLRETENAPRTNDGASVSMHCAATPGRTRGGLAPCIEAREDGKPCGPGGALFHAR